jgi:hypothetical protein
MCDAIPPTRRQQSEHEQPSYLHHDGRPCRNADRLKEMLKEAGKPVSGKKAELIERLKE